MLCGSRSELPNPGLPAWRTNPCLRNALAGTPGAVDGVGVPKERAGGAQELFLRNAAGMRWVGKLQGLVSPTPPENPRPHPSSCLLAAEAARGSFGAVPSIFPRARQRHGVVLLSQPSQSLRGAGDSPWDQGDTGEPRRATTPPSELEPCAGRGPAPW